MQTDYAPRADRVQVRLQRDVFFPGYILREIIQQDTG
jgi:hypothetical protein